MLMNAPAMKPRRRPTLAIHSDIGIVDSADPSTYVVAPSVATVLKSTSEYPIRAFIEIRAAALVNSSAWHNARRKMLRYEVAIAG